MVNYRFYLSLDHFSISGLPAVDFCRKFGLEEQDSVWAPGDVGEKIDVDEAFARTWFGNNVADHAKIDVAWLVDGEIRIEDGAKLFLTRHLTLERAKDLYVRAQIAALETPKPVVVGDDDLADYNEEL